MRFMSLNKLVIKTTVTLSPESEAVDVVTSRVLTYEILIIESGT